MIEDVIQSGIWKKDLLQLSFAMAKGKPQVLFFYSDKKASKIFFNLGGGEESFWEKFFGPSAFFRRNLDKIQACLLLDDGAVLREERKTLRRINRSKALAREYVHPAFNFYLISDQCLFGSLNYLARNWIPGESKKDFFVFLNSYQEKKPLRLDVGRFLDLETKLERACDKHPAEIKKMAEVLLFDKAGSSKLVPEEGFLKRFWMASPLDKEWITRVDVLYKKGLLSTKQASQIFISLLSDKDLFSQEHFIILHPCVEEMDLSPMIVTLENLRRSLMEAPDLDWNDFYDFKMNEKIVNHFKTVPGEGASLFVDFISAMNFIIEKDVLLAKTKEAGNKEV